MSEPIPLESGDLKPPTTHPPTAVGTATPPPPPSGRIYPFLLPTSYKAEIVLGLSGLGGVALAWVSPWGMLAAVGRGLALGMALVLGFAVWHRRRLSRVYWRIDALMDRARGLNTRSDPDARPSD